MRQALSIVFLLALAAAAEAAEPYVGTWSEDLKLCKGGDFHWTFTATQAYNEAFTCLQASYVRTGPGGWIVHMKNCNNEESHFATEERIAVHGDVLEVEGKRFHRCPD